MTNSNLPLANPETFLGECETLDLSDIKDKSFMVAINSGAREKGKFICETVHGPYNFLEMVEEVSAMWGFDVHHSKVYVLSKDRHEPAQWLSEMHIDFIEARAKDIITDAFVEGTLGAPTCRAELVSCADEDPRQQKQQGEATSEEEVK